MNFNCLFLSVFQRILVFCFCIIAVFTIRSNAQEIDSENLIREISTDTQKGAVFNYSYMMKVYFQRNKNGKIDKKFTRLYDAILPSRFSLNNTYTHPFILFQDTEKEISAMEIAQMRKELAKKLEKAENEAENQEAKENSNNDGGYWTMRFSYDTLSIKIDVLNLLNNSHLKNFRRKQIDGKEIILIDFTPKQEAVFDKTMLYLSKTEGQIWVDEKDKRIIRIEGFPLGTFETHKNKGETERLEEAVFLFIQTKVKEGFWFPQTVAFNFIKNPEIYDPVKIVFTFSNYRRAGVEVRNVESKSPEESNNHKQLKEN